VVEDQCRIPSMGVEVQMKPYRSLGFYHPPEWDLDIVGLDLTNLTRRLGLVPFSGIPHNLDDYCAWYSEKLMAGIRRRTAVGAQGEQWHQDGDTTPGANMFQAVVLWASNNHTQFRWAGAGTENRIFQPEPWEVVIFRNREVYHRRPPGAPRVRWTFRQRVELS